MESTSKDALISRLYGHSTQNIESTLEDLFVGFLLRNGRRRSDSGGLKLRPSGWPEMNPSPPVTPCAQRGIFDLMLLENIAMNIKA